MLGLGLSLSLGAQRSGGVPVDPFLRDAFATDAEFQANYAVATGHASVYHAASDTTFYTYSAWDMGLAKRVVKVISYDHAAGKWSAAYTVSTATLTGDTHGVPAIVILDSGRLAIFFGSHSSAQKWSMSDNPLDITAWTAQTDIATTGGMSYPKPFNVGGTVYLMGRGTGSGTSELILYVITFAGAGDAPTVGSRQVIAHFDATGGRMYAGQGFVRSGKIHLAWTQSDGADTWRRHIHVGIFDPATSTWNSFGGARTDAIPLGEATMISFYRVFTHTAPDQGNVPTFNYDSSGNPHLLFGDDEYGIAIKHLWHNGTAWQSPVAAFDESMGTDLAAPAPTPSIHPTSTGIRSYYVRETQGLTWARGGDACYRDWTPAGGWGSETIIKLATHHSFLQMVWPLAAHDDLHVIFSEGGGDVTVSEPGMIYAYGDAGYVTWDRDRGDTAAAAYVARLGFTPSQTVQDALAAYFDAWIQAGEWDGLIAHPIFIWPTAQWVNARSSSYNPANSGMAWVANTGIQGNGTSAFADTGFRGGVDETALFNPSGGGMIMFYSETDGAQVVDFGANNTAFNIRNTSNQINAKVTTTGATVNVSNTQGVGHASAVKRSQTDLRLFLDGQLMGAGGGQTAANETVNYTIGKRNSTSSFTSRTYSMYAIARATSDWRVEAIYDAWTTLRAILRAQ